MPEEKKIRSTKEIQQEYQNLTFKAGVYQYEIACKQKDLSLLNDTMRDLNFEYVSAKKAEDETAALESKKETSEEVKNA